MVQANLLQFRINITTKTFLKTGGKMFELFSMFGQYLCFFILHVCGGNSFPKPLSEKQEREYLEQAANGSNEARNKLVEHNLRLVAHIIKKYYGTQSEQDDLVSIGTIGLIKAINTFDMNKNIRLSSYASRCIENPILSHWLTPLCRQMKRQTL